MYVRATSHEGGQGHDDWFRVYLLFPATAAANCCCSAAATAEKVLTSDVFPYCCPFLYFRFSVFFSNGLATGGQKPKSDEWGGLVAVMAVLKGNGSGGGYGRIYLMTIIMRFDFSRRRAMGRKVKGCMPPTQPPQSPLEGETQSERLSMDT